MIKKKCVILVLVLFFSVFITNAQYTNFESFKPYIYNWTCLGIISSGSCSNVFDSDITNNVIFNQCPYATITVNLNKTFYAINFSNVMIQDPSVAYFSPKYVSLYINGDFLGNWTNPYSLGSCSGPGGSVNRTILSSEIAIDEGFNQMVYYIGCSNQDSCVDNNAGVYTFQLLVSNEVNSLPVINEFSVDSNNICFENGLSEINLDLTINATDEENDTIYYAIDDFNIGKTSVLFYEEFFISDGGKCDPDYNVLNDGTIITNGTIATNLASTLYYGGLGIAFLGVKENSCDGYLTVYKDLEDFYFNLGNTFQENTVTTLQMGFPDTVNINITPMSSFNEFYDLTFNYDTTNLTIILNGTTLYNANKDSWIESIAGLPSLNGVNVIIEQDINNNYTLFSFVIYDNINDVTAFQYQYNITFDDYSYIKVEQDNNNRFYVFDLVRVTGQNIYYVPEFSTTKPTNYSIFSTQNKERIIDLYVTDNIHLERSYNNESITIKIVSCDTLITNDIEINGISTVSALSSFRTSINNLCDWKIVGIPFCWVFHSIFITVSFAVALVLGYGLLRSFATAYFLFSLFLVFSSFILPFTLSFKIIFAVLFALSLANIIFKTFMGGSNTGVEIE